MDDKLQIDYKFTVSKGYFYQASDTRLYIFVLAVYYLIRTLHFCNDGIHRNVIVMIVFKRLQCSVQ